MALIWTDIYDIAIALEEQYPETDIMNIRFTDLWQMVQNLPDFTASADRCNEKILQAIQAAWLDERS